MPASECLEFLQWALPRVGLRWEGFRRVRRQVCKRVGRRVQALQLSDFRAYRAYVDSHPDEWRILASLCHISTSRFGRDRAVFEELAGTVLPTLAAGAVSRPARVLKCWSAGCASGEEPYSVSMLWQLEVTSPVPSLSITILATDVDSHLLERAREGRYARSSLRELPRSWTDEAFEHEDDTYVVRAEFRTAVEFRLQDMRTDLPDGQFDLILCRNVAFTYFDEPTQRDTLDRLLSTLRPGGGFIIGRKERLPGETRELVEWVPTFGIFRKHEGV